MKTILQKISARTGCMPVAIERYIYYTGIKPKKLLDQLEAADMPEIFEFIEQVIIYQPTENKLKNINKEIKKWNQKYL
jgi:hypothetical protein